MTEELITITVNGNERELPEGSTVADLLAVLELDSRYLAVEKNRELVPRKQHATCEIQPNDSLEIVTLVGGG